MVGQQILDLPIGVRIPAGQPIFLSSSYCMSKKILLATLLFIVAGATYYISKNPDPKSIISMIPQGVRPEPTPGPFEEITIPYLRKKEYNSELGQLREVAGNSNYTSYLTSYTSDGLKINGLLTIPTGTVPTGGFPAIVFVHGYIPPTLYQTLEKYTDYVDYLARNGFVVFKIDLRGHGNSEGEPGGGYFGADYVTDTLNAYSALQNSDFVNRNKIGLWGHSMAGNIVMRSLAVRPNIPAVDIWAGAVYTYTDQREYGINDQSYRPPQSATALRNRRQALFEKVGSPSADSKFWQLVAPTSFLTDIKGAVQINHATDDEVVDIRYSRNLNMLLDKTSVPHELYEYQSGGHNFTGSTFTEAMDRTVDFFNKYLKN